MHTALTVALLGVVMVAQPAPNHYERVLSALLEKDWSLADDQWRQLKESEPSASLIESLVWAIRNDMALQSALDRGFSFLNLKNEDITPELLSQVQRKNTRRRAFTWLLSIGVSDSSGRLVFTHPDQARLVLDAIRDRDPAGMQLALQRVHLLDERHHAEAVETLRPLLQSKHPSDVAEAAQALGRLGEASRPALPALRDLLMNPADANPEAWKAVSEVPPEWLEQLPDGDLRRDELIARFASGDLQVSFLTSVAAARVRIAPEALLGDLDIYTQSPLLNRVGVRVLGSLTLTRDDHFFEDAASLRKAAPFLCGVAQRTSESPYRRAAVRAIEGVLRSPRVSDEIKALWRTQALEAATRTSSEETRRMLLAVVGEG